MHAKMQNLKMSDKVRSTRAEARSIQRGNINLAELKDAVRSGLLEKVTVRHSDNAYRVYATLRNSEYAMEYALENSRGTQLREFKKPYTYAKLLKSIGINKWSMETKK